MWKSRPEKQCPRATPFIVDGAGTTALSPLPAVGRSDRVSWACLLALKPCDGSFEAKSRFFLLHLRSPLEFRLIGNDQKEPPSTAQLWAGCFLPGPLTEIPDLLNTLPLSYLLPGCFSGALHLPGLVPFSCRQGVSTSRDLPTHSWAELPLQLEKLGQFQIGLPDI